MEFSLRGQLRQSLASSAFTLPTCKPSVQRATFLLCLKESCLRHVPSTFLELPTKNMKFSFGENTSSRREKQRTALSSSGVRCHGFSPIAHDAQVGADTVQMAQVPNESECFFQSLKSQSLGFMDTAAVSAGASIFSSVQLSHDLQDLTTMIAALTLALTWVRLFDELVARAFLDQKLSRKMIHISMGMLFMLSWPFFSASPEARYFAAAVPAANCIRLAALGLGITKNDAVVKAISREGDASELLRGPLFYALVVTLVTSVVWRSSPVGCIALVMMCGGDGIADIVGRRLGKTKLPWNSNKSWAGSISMFLLGSLLSSLFVWFFCHLGFFETHWWGMASILKIMIVAFGATVVESLPISTKLDDNFTVPFTSAVLAMFLFP